MYLKIPEFLPDRKSHDKTDGKISFTNNASRDPMWGSPAFAILPKPGDFYIFPATQIHQVYPFRTADGKGERRSVSFNTLFTSKSMMEEEAKQAEKLKEWDVQVKGRMQRSTGKHGQRQETDRTLPPMMEVDQPVQMSEMTEQDMLPRPSVKRLKNGYKI